MKIENVAFLIPIHPPHYHYIYSLIETFKNNDIQMDIYLVFSNEEDYEKFSMKDSIEYIICEPTETKSIVTYKKFFGLQQLADSKYDYIICCDSEIDIIPSNFTSKNINNKIRQIFNNKKIYAGSTDDTLPTGITKTSANLFPKSYEYLTYITKNFSLYFWWSDLPVYKRVHITQFLNLINYDIIVHEHFDYIIYQYYLILFHDFEIIDTTPITNIHWSLEKLFTDDSNVLNGLLAINYGFSWNTKKFYDLNKSFIELQKGFLIYHLDRH